MLAAIQSMCSRGSGRGTLTKALLLALVSCLVVPASFFEAASQLPNGKASFIQLPLITTPTTIQLPREQREKILRGDVKEGQLKLLSESAKSRLADEPLDATALWLWSVPQGPTLRLRALELAQRVSLRETTVQLQLLRTKALAGDLSASLEHLDNVLLVSPSSSQPMLQTIAKGLDQSKLVELLKPYGSRAWYKQLLQQSVLYSPRPENAANLLLQTNLSSDELPPYLITSLLDRLVAADRYEDAKTVARRFVGLRESTFLNFALTAETVEEQAAPLTWVLSNDLNLAGEPVSNGVRFDIERGHGGALMSRVTNYTAGTYRLRQTIETSTSDLAVRWELQCLTEQNFTNRWSQTIPAAMRKQVFETQVVIDEDCDIQRWQLSSLNELGEQQATLVITKLQLSKR